VGVVVLGSMHPKETFGVPGTFRWIVQLSPETPGVATMDLAGSLNIKRKATHSLVFSSFVVA